MIPDKQPSIIATLLAIIFGVFVIVASIVVAPFIVLLIGMAIGWLLEVFTGDYVVQAFNAVGLTGVQDGDLPKVFGLLAVVAALIKVGVGNGKKKTKSDE